MAVKVKKPSATEQAYTKELKRIQSFIRRAKKRGYSFPSDVIPDKPKRITKKSVEKLQKLSYKELYAKSTYYDIVIDKRVSGTEEQHLVRSRASKKVAETRKYKKSFNGTITVAGQPPLEADDVLQYVFELIANWKPDVRWSDGLAKIKEHDKNTLERALLGAINELGQSQVARNCQNNASEIKELAWYICYGFSGDKKDSGYQADMIRFVRIIRGRALTVDEAKEMQDMVDSYDYEDTEE